MHDHFQFLNLLKSNKCLSLSIVMIFSKRMPCRNNMFLVISELVKVINLDSFIGNKEFFSYRYKIRKYSDLRLAAACPISQGSTCSRPMGKAAWTSVVIHSLNDLLTLSDSVTVSSISWQKSRLRWQFWSSSQRPAAMASARRRLAWASCPCPMDIDRISGERCKR